jgi:catechol 2,3-dioxygenase-like lactoylglutathione lyase family enzyme
MDGKLELVAIPVSDVDRAKSFYTDQVCAPSRITTPSLTGSPLPGMSRLAVIRSMISPLGRRPARRGSAGTSRAGWPGPLAPGLILTAAAPARPARPETAASGGPGRHRPPPVLDP